MDEASVLTARPRMEIAFSISQAVVFSARAYKMPGCPDGVALCSVPARFGIALEIVPVERANPAAGVHLCSILHGSTYYLTEQVSPYISGTGAGRVLEMSREARDAVLVHLNLNRERHAVSFGKSDGRALTVDTRGYGLSFQPQQAGNNPPIYQHFQCRLTYESFTIANPETNLVLTCAQAAQGALVTAERSMGSDKQLWLEDFTRGLLLHKASGLALDVLRGVHPRLCVNPIDRIGDMPRWAFSDQFLVFADSAQVCTGHANIKGLTLEEKDPNRRRFQRWEVAPPG